MAPWRRSTVFGVSELSTVASNGQHSWDAEIHLLRSDLDPLAYTAVWLVSEFLILAALLVFLPAACAAKQFSNGDTALFPSLAVIGSIVSYILSQIVSVIFLMGYFLEATVKQSYAVVGILQLIFGLLALLLLCYALFRVVHAALARISFPTGPSILVARGHWGVVGVLSGVVIANCAVRIASIVKDVEGGPAARGIAVHDNRLTTARAVLFMIISLEILLWAIFSTAKVFSDSGRPNSKIRPITFIVSSVSYFVLILAAAIHTIRYVYLRVPPPGYLNAAGAIVEFFSVVGIYTGLIIHWMQGGKEEEAASRQSPLHGQRPAERKVSVPYRPSIGEVLSQPKVFGTDGTWMGSSGEAFMSGGR